MVSSPPGLHLFGALGPECSLFLLSTVELRMCLCFKCWQCQLTLIVMVRVLVAPTLFSAFLCSETPSPLPRFYSMSENKVDGGLASLAMG